MAQLSKVEFDELPEKLKTDSRRHISDKETVLFCVLSKSFRNSSLTPDMVMVVTDYQLVIICYHGGPFDHNAEMYVSFNQHNVSMRGNWTLTPGYSDLGPVAVHSHNPLFGRAGWKVHFDLGYRTSLGNASPLGLFFDNEALAGELVAVIQKAKNDDFVRSRTPAGSQNVDIGDQLMKLAALRDKGDLTQAEFEAAKKKLLGS